MERPGSATGTGAARAVLSTLVNDAPFWQDQVEVVRADVHPRLLGWLRAFARASRGKQAVIVRGTVTLRDGYRDLLGAVLLRRILRFRGVVVVSDATIEPGSRALVAAAPRRLQPAVDRLARLGSKVLVRLADGPRVRWCVLSRAELVSFPQVWGVDPARMRFTAFSHTLWDERGTDVPTAQGGYFFAGGDSMRDYDLLQEAARGTDLEVVIASRRWRSDPGCPQISVVTTTHEAFVDLMAGSLAVVVPLVQSTRSAGQQTYLNAMALGKVVVVNDAPGVRDHIVDGVDGVVAASDPVSLRTALLRVRDELAATGMPELRSAARRTGLARDDRAYVGELLEIAGGR